jgi:hypothetical protein
MTLRIVVDRHGGVASYAILDNATLPGPTHLTPLVMGNLALLKLAPIGDVVNNVGVRLTSMVFIVCQLPPNYNPRLEDIMLYLKSQVCP